MISIYLIIIEILISIVLTTTYVSKYQLKQSKFHVNKRLDSTKESELSTNNIAIAKDFLTNRFGLNKKELLDNKFIDSQSNYQQYDKSTYLTTYLKQQLSFYRAIPDYDLRYYDVQQDDLDESTVWYKLRPTGTFSGNLSYQGDVYLPNNKVVEFPLILGSVTIKDNKIIRSTSNYLADRFVGNTGGFIDSKGLLFSSDLKPSPFSYLPPLAVFKNLINIFRKPVSRVAVSSPLPEPVLFSLTKQLIASLFTSIDSSELLTDDFQATSPYTGPIDKKQFVNEFKKLDIVKALPDFNYNPRNLHIDSYERDRVFAIIQSTGTFTNKLTNPITNQVISEPNNKKLIGAPEAISFSFNKEGLCYKASYGYVLDRQAGNSNGLGGVDGILEGLGLATNWLDSRPIPEVFTLLSLAIKKLQTPALPTSNPVSKIENQVVSKVDSKPAVKIDSKIVEKPISPPVSKVDSKPAVKIDSKIVDKPISPPVSKVDSKPVVKVNSPSVSKIDSKIDIKPVTKADTKVIDKPIVKVDSKITTPVTTKPVSQPVSKADSKIDNKVTSKPSVASTSKPISPVVKQVDVKPTSQTVSQVTNKPVNNGFFSFLSPSPVLPTSKPSNVKTTASPISQKNNSTSNPSFFSFSISTASPPVKSTNSSIVKQTTSKPTNSVSKPVINQVVKPATSSVTNSPTTRPSTNTTTGSSNGFFNGFFSSNSITYNKTIESNKSTNTLNNKSINSSTIKSTNSSTTKPISKK